MSTPLVNLLQVEYCRAGTKGYKPKSSKPYTDLTIPATQQVMPDYSDHATYVAQLWQQYGAGALVKDWFVCEATNWEVNYLKAGKTLPPVKGPNVHLVIMPYGMNATWTGTDKYGSCTKLQQWAEANNAIVFKSPPDAGMGFYQSPGQAVGANLITVASSTTGSNLTNQPPVDIYFAQDWNSYAEPALLAAGLMIPVVQWILENGFPWEPQVIARFIKASVHEDNVGRPMYSATALQSIVKTHYQPFNVLPQPAPPAPVVVPPEPAPAPVVPPPIIGLPSIQRFDHGVSNAWTDDTHPSIFYIQVSNADTVTLTDPKGVTQDVTGKSQVSVTGKYSGGCSWTLKATNKNGTTSKTEVAVHGCF